MGNSSTSSTSSTSQNASKTRKPFHFRSKIKVQNIQIVLRNLHQNTIKLSVKNLKQSNNTQLLRRSSKFYVVLLSSTSFYVLVLSSPAIVVDFWGFIP
ncbi:hypothetical protein AHAS_Ahas15G0206200 [Arachis hypogaea]